MRLHRHDAFAAAVLAYALALAAWIGPDAWMLGAMAGALAVAALFLGVGLFLAALARDGAAARPRWRRFPALAGGVALLVSCVMAAALARDGGPFRATYWGLAFAMLSGVAAVRLAYHPQ